MTIIETLSNLQIPEVRESDELYLQVLEFIRSNGLDEERFKLEVVDEYYDGDNEYGDGAWADPEYSTWRNYFDVYKAVEWLQQEQGKRGPRPDQP